MKPVFATASPLLLPLLLLLLPLAFSATATAAAPRACPAGQLRSKGVCTACPPGTYREENKPNECRACKPGTFQPAHGAIHRDLCRLCPRGTFADKEGMASCHKCPVGSSAGYAATACASCRPGESLSYFGSSCVACDEGTYSAGGGSNSCTDCPSAMTAPKRAVSVSQCRACRKGEFYPCYSCPRNTIVREDECAACPAGTVSGGGYLSSFSDCKPCPKGLYRRRGSDGACVKCPAGKIAHGPGAMFCREAGVACPKGFFTNVHGDCERCSPGFRYDAAGKKCVACAAGSVSPGGLAKKCRVCTGGLKEDAVRGECVCGLGEFFNEVRGRCFKCQVGSSRSDAYHKFPRCIPCKVGHVATKTGAVMCTRCPDGLVASDRQDKCVTCGKGKLPNPLSKLNLLGSHGHSSCVVARTGCLKTWTRIVKGTYSYCKPVYCSRSSTERDIGRTCVGCGPGAIVRPDGKPGCMICPQDSASFGGLAKKCMKCPNGLRRNSRVESTCSCIGLYALGYGLGKDKVCRKCKVGWYSTANDETCRKCPAGQSNDMEGSWYCLENNGVRR